VEVKRCGQEERKGEAKDELVRDQERTVSLA
jgi:hypothetical protein